MVLLAQAGVLLLTAVFLQSSHTSEAEFVRSCHLDVIEPGDRPCPDVCILVYDPVCVVGRRTPPTTFSNSCFAGIYACEQQEVLWVIRNGPCHRRSRTRFINP